LILQYKKTLYIKEIIENNVKYDLLYQKKKKNHIFGCILLVSKLFKIFTTGLFKVYNNFRFKTLPNNTKYFFSYAIYLRNNVKTIPRDENKQIIFILFVLYHIKL